MKERTSIFSRVTAGILSTSLGIGGPLSAQEHNRSKSQIPQPDNSQQKLEQEVKRIDNEVIGGMVNGLFDRGCDVVFVYKAEGIFKPMDCVTIVNPDPKEKPQKIKPPNKNF